MKMRLLKFAGSLMFIIASSAVFAQDPPPPPGGGHGQNTNQTPGGSAPIGSGIALLLSMAGLYGGKKVYDARKKLME
ncbi:MAG: hypothetical protein PWR20_2510 [Bacteroidales bacterium]|jgi:hypothetical protein|nr:hypothetical protein [Bacteroidales bacterium]MDN5328518.1 hypothetical protein [Bacteroidales bacterium]